MQSRPVVMIGIDAAEIRVIERLLAEDRLPNLAALRRHGRYGRMVTRPDGFLSMVWPTLNNGTGIGTHGFYYYKLWRAERQRIEVPDETTLSQKPGWNDLAAAGLRMGLVDIPALMAPPPGLDGVFLNGWQTHDDFRHHEVPGGLRRQLSTTFGPPRMKPEFFGAQTGASLLRLRREMLDSLEQIGAIAAHMLENGRFDLFAVVLGGVHRGGHYLWDLSQIDQATLTAEDRRVLEGANDDLYVAADAAVGRIVERSPDDARILVLALHGMAANNGWSERFPALVARIRDGASERPRSGLVYRIKQALPWKAVREVTTRLPVPVNQWLVQVWSARMLDWTSTPYFALPVDLNGYVRLNIKGRERNGILLPGEQSEALLAELSEALLSFRGIESDTPAVGKVERTDDLVGCSAAGRSLLPDLVVSWGDTSSAELSGVTSPQHGEIRWEKGARLFSGRSGNHVGDGWFIAVGDGIDAGHDTSVPDGCDVMPTIFRWLGQPLPERFEGRPIDGLTGSKTGSETPLEVEA